MGRGWRLLWCLLCVAQGAAQTTIRARPVLHEDALAYRGVYVVDVQRRGGDTRGVLIVRDALGVQSTYELDLAANARKRLYLNIAIQRPRGNSHRVGAPRIEWQSMDGERTPIDTPSPAPIHLPIVVVGDLIGGLETLNRQSVEVSSILAPRDKNSRVPLKVYYWRASDLPDDWRALLELPFLVLTEGAETLTDAQLRALYTWLNAGGTLLIDTGAFINWRATPFAELIAPTQFATPYQPAHRTQDAPKLLYRRVGRGILYLYEGNLRMARADNRHEPILLRIAQGVVLPSEQLQREFQAWVEAARPPTRYARVWAGIAVLCAYAAAVWLLSAWLRRRRRLASVFKPLAGLTLIASVAIALLAPRLPQRNPVVMHTVYQNDTTPTLEFSVLSATLGAGRYRLTLPDDALLLEARTQPSASLSVRYSTAPPEAQLRCHAHTTVMLCFARPVASEPRLTVQRTDDRLIIRNIGREALLSVNLQLQHSPLTPSSTLWERERLLPNQTATIQLPPVMRRALLWLRATLPRREPAVALSGEPVQEVSYLFVEVP